VKLKDKVALVTGGSSGIGEAISRLFAREGAIVAVAGGSSLDRAAAVSASICDQGGRATPFVADLRKVAEVQGLVDGVIAKYGTVNILVNSAGVFYPTPLGGIREEDFDRMVDVNLKGLFFAINAVVPAMAAQGGGHIVNIASVAAFVGSAQFPLYCAVKSAVVAITRALALSLAPQGIHINAIAPGNTATPMNESIRTAPEFAERRGLIDALTPSTRKFSEAEDIAAGALFLASADARAMHGATIVMDEGRSAGW
jgi:NAD(P)-dependent dehydrogenase (short-subunit alcohol dehydrogenase family)